MSTYWNLTLEGDGKRTWELTDLDREYIAELIVNGYTSGELVSEGDR